MPVNEDKNIGATVENRKTEQRGMPQEHVPDGYWLIMGTNAVAILSEDLRADLTEAGRQNVANYLAKIMDHAYRMGIRLGETKAQVDAWEKHSTP